LEDTINEDLIDFKLEIVDLELLDSLGIGEFGIFHQTLHHFHGSISEGSIRNYLPLLAFALNKVNSFTKNTIKEILKMFNNSSIINLVEL